MERHQVALYLSSMAVGSCLRGAGRMESGLRHLVPLRARCATVDQLRPHAPGLMNVGQHKDACSQGVVLAATLEPRFWLRCSFPSLIPRGSRCFSCSDCSAGSMRGLRCGLYVYRRRNIEGLLAATPYSGPQILSISMD